MRPIPAPSAEFGVTSQQPKSAVAAGAAASRWQCAAASAPASVRIESARRRGELSIGRSSRVARSLAAALVEQLQVAAGLGVVDAVGGGLREHHASGLEALVVVVELAH